MRQKDSNLKKFIKKTKTKFKQYNNHNQEINKSNLKHKYFFKMSTANPFHQTILIFQTL